MKRMQRWIAAMLAGSMIGFGIPCAGAEENASGTEADAGRATAGWTVEERGLTLGESAVAYPVITGFAEEDFEKAVNERILADTGIPEYLTRLSQLISGGRLRVSWRGGLPGEDVFSCAVSAEGAVRTPRSDFVWTWSNLDLRTGEEIPWEALFTDAPSASAELEAWLEETVAPELSAYLLSGNVTPLPEGFWLTRRGIVLLYSREQWNTLSDRAGDLLISWNEIQQVLDLSEDGVPARVGAAEMLVLTDESLPRLQAMTAEGAIPDLPVRLGDSLAEAVDAWHLLIDPDVYEGGRMFSLEGALFRNVFLLTDYLSEDWENSRVDGIRMDSGCLYGLRIGQTQAWEWHQTLGEPDAAVDFDEARAEAWRTVPGSRDYYAWGDHTLQLHADEDGVLVSIILTE